MTHRAAFIVTHLLGTGHLSRTLTLARALAVSGIESHVISGGVPVPHLHSGAVHLHQVPPLRSDGTDFTNLLTADGKPADTRFLDHRTRQICGILEDLRPDIVVTELFPFGRRNLRKEFIALLETASAMSPRPQILCSIRDILAPPSKPSKVTFAEQVIAQFHDHVLVHSDPDVVPLEHSWPVSDAVSGKLHYTGFVAPPLPPASEPGPEDGRDEILVSAGGGNVGQALFDCAIKAAAQTSHTWRLLIPGKPDECTGAGPGVNLPGNVIVDKIRPDFRQMLQKGAASVSLCGYNTTMDLLQSGIPAVIVPYDEGGEVEQTIRAKALGHLHGVASHAMAGLTPDSLASSVARLARMERRKTDGINLDGTQETVRFCKDLLT